jgi:hypothetical protein
VAVHGIYLPNAFSEYPTRVGADFTLPFQMIFLMEKKVEEHTAALVGNLELCCSIYFVENCKAEVLLAVSILLMVF